MSTISVRNLTKRYGDVRAVDDVSFDVEPGVVTAFLGPNGSGKTTTMRVLLGLAHPTAGTALVAGRRYAELPDPSRVVGALLDPVGAHPRRRARDHLRIQAAASGVPATRVDEVLALVGLGGAAKRLVGGFSTGMRQRLGLAGALLADPGVLVLDEPANGLDPDGIRELRLLLRRLAGEGRTVFVSSHQLAEVAQTADAAVIVRGGRVVAQGRLADLMPEARGVVVRSPERERLLDALARAGLPAAAGPDGAIAVAGATPEQVGTLVARAGVPVHELSPQNQTLEDLFLALTSGGVS